MGSSLIIGDALTVMRTMPAASVDLVVTSSPFLGLRSYLPADHPDKLLEMGSEPTPGEFIDTLLDVVEESRRVLAPHGSICFELGDTYSAARGYGKVGSNPMYGDRADTRLIEARVARNFKKKGDDAWPEEKSLCMVPELFRVALAYGRNPLTGRETARWRVRNVVRWCRPNPPVGALGDKVRPATSDMVIACVGRRRYFDLDAVRSPYKFPDQVRAPLSNYNNAEGGDNYRRGLIGEFRAKDGAGAPPLDHWWEDDDRFDQDAWHIPTQSYKGAHYATWPERLVVRPILAMCPERVCTACGVPSKRLVASSRYVEGHPSEKRIGNEESMAGEPRQDRSNGQNTFVVRDTLGWSNCGHDAWRNGVVLDPFAGSGTTLAVAVGHGRDAIGIDIDDRNRQLVEERCSPEQLAKMHVRVLKESPRRGAAA